MEPDTTTTENATEAAEVTVQEVPAAVTFDEFDITVSSSTKLNLGDYSSAERSVFLKGRARIERRTPEEDLDNLRAAIRKLQLVADAQLAWIVADAMGREKLNNREWAGLFRDIFKQTLEMTKKAFGILPPPPEITSTSNATPATNDKPSA